MAKEIFVNADTRETRIAVREDNKLIELHIEREERVVGNIYKGRVDNILPGMEAAFVEIGLDRNAFLYAGDITGTGNAGDEPDDEPAPTEKNDKQRGNMRRGRNAPSHIRDLVKRGQEILVQVSKGPRGSKGCRVSTKMSLPGRYLVFMPDEASIGVSRKIDEPKERDRLKKIVESIRKPGYGLIIRTEAEDKTERELRQDLEFLERTWNDIKEKARQTPSGNLVYSDLTLLLRILRDTFGQDVERMVLDSAIDYKRAHELLDFFGPSLKDRVHLYNGEKPIFEHFNIEQDIERLLRRRVWLKSGGYLIIEQTEALVSIDVNSGRFAGNKDGGLADTIVQTNLEAVEEIARQLRLRDMGGIIILDLIDMASANDRKRVETAFEAALKRDKNRCKVSHISSLGLIEMTRKRTGETLNEQMDEPCPYCAGSAKIPSADSVSISIERDLRRLARTQPGEAFLVSCNPQVAAYLVGEGGEDIEKLEHALQRGIYVRASDELHQEKYEVQPGKMDDLDRRLINFKRGQVIDVQVVRNALLAPPAAIGVTTNGYIVEIAQGARFVGQTIRVRLTHMGRSVGIAELLGKGGGTPTEHSAISGAGSHHRGGGGGQQPDTPRQNAPRGQSPRNNDDSGSGGGGTEGQGGRNRNRNRNRNRGAGGSGGNRPQTAPAG